METNIQNNFTTCSSDNKEDISFDTQRRSRLLKGNFLSLLCKREILVKVILLIKG